MSDTMNTHTEKGHVTLGFYGGVGTVTGANFLLSTPEGNVIVDCGMFQGMRMCNPNNANMFGYDLSTLDALIVTHAHIDHIGRIPKLVKDGFRGPIYSTIETRELAEVMLPDAAGLIVKEAILCGEEPSYTAEDVAPVFLQWKTVPYYTPFTIADMTFEFKNAGHILGSALVQCIHPSVGKIIFTGDLGNSPSLIMKDTDVIEDANILVMESVYGDRVHEEVPDRLAQLEDVIENTIKNKGTLLIPTFSIERTQNILYEVNMLIEEARIPHIDVYLDSPLATAVTEVYKRHPDNFNEKTQQAIAAGDDVFAFKGLRVVSSTQESKAIYETPGPKIIIAGSGMSHGGRIIGHEKHYLSDPLCTLLIVGYQTPGSLGRQLADGAKKVTIGKEEIDIHATVRSVSGYSGHRDMNGLIRFVNATSLTLRKVFVTMGEPKTSQFFAQRLRDYLGVNAVYPNLHDVVDISK
ncbi:MBL fold metallo-hydrolase [Candidatus Campbellbacteria bacterium]|nr:MAG: MBL fold metallo-hydrolase [Candidatus Campbellbacteria bacterium]